MNNDRFESWLRKIYNTQENEISCSECFDLVSSFVDLELAGGHPEVKMPLVVQHLHQCAACREEYEALRDLRHLEEDGDSPSIDDLQDLIK